MERTTRDPAGNEMIFMRFNNVPVFVGVMVGRPSGYKDRIEINTEYWRSIL
jgi:hypothetical protein